MSRQGVWMNTNFRAHAVSRCKHKRYVTMSRIQYHYSVGGVRVKSGLPLGLPIHDWTDAELSIEFGLNKTSYPQWISLSLPRMPKIRISPNGKLASVRVPLHAPASEARSVLARAIVPFAAALQGRLTLHACCVAVGNCHIAMVGASGAGKSTLGRAFSQHGFRVISDDLLPVRYLSPTIMGVPDSMVLGLEPLSALIFPTRDGKRTPEIHPLAPVAAMVLLLRHGFGEMHSPNIWKMQFTDYAQLARTVPAFSMTLPNDLTRLHESVDLLQKFCGCLT